MTPPLQMWGGHECTVNRVGDVWRDQTRLVGHQERVDDLDRFASLGLKALRYPVLWERTEIEPGRFDWSWADERLSRIRELGMEPIVGLTHHGSGPAWTNLLDESFAPGLAAFAARAGERYPWVRRWTPVNEPLTTARFSALYGHWHPHARDEVSLWTALLNQIDAVRLSMDAIRKARPDAELVQTEDFGRTYATEPCAHQAAHENARRLMTWDLLTGAVVEGHPLHRRLTALGFGRRLETIAAAPCPPAVIGLNHYATSDRFLDHRLDRYPAATHGGNGALVYADVEAVRVLDPPPPGWSEHLRTLWERYRLPIAITECHLGCTREEQLRWLSECWDAALDAREQGVRVEAVTVWNLLGGFDWDSLLTQPNGRYESGVFTLRNGRPEPTALARLVRDLATTGATDIPLAHEPGWWRRPERLAYAAHATTAAEPPPPARRPSTQPILIRGALQQRMRRACEERGLNVVWSDDEGSAEERPWLVLAPSPDEEATPSALDRWLDDRLADGAEAAT